MFRGAGQTLVTSASSKTSICLAACLARREGHRSIGVTSPRNRSIARAFHDLLAHTERWLTVVHRTGPDGIEATYRELLEGRADPAIGYVCSMSETSPP